MLQPERDNIFQRTWHDLQMHANSGLYSQMSQGRLIFEACILTIQSVVNIVNTRPAFIIQQADLVDYAYALVDIQNFFRDSSNDHIGTQYPFSKLMYPLDKAAQHLYEAVGETNVYLKERTENIQTFSSWLSKTLEQIAGLGDPPP